MPCYHPIRVPITRDSCVRGKISWMQEVGCGHCLGCRAEQARQWAVRMYHETTMHEHAWFVTLTYSDERLPENGSLVPQDFRAFVKALRRDYPPGSISYFGCGEYGDRTRRPHYHAVLFGPDFLDRTVLRTTSNGHVWRSATLERYWPHGISEFGSVTMGSAAYVAGYVRKKVRKQDHPDHYTVVDPETGELHELEPEFARMSLRPAIAARWIKKWWREVYKFDEVIIEGKQSRPPRYYDKWMEMDHHDPKSVHYDPTCPCDEHRALMVEVREKRYEALEQLQPEQLLNREAHHQARIDLFQGRDAV